MVVIDATFLLLLLRPETPVPVGPNGLPVQKAKERIELLVHQLEQARSKVLIPTPALSEALVHAGAAASQEIVDRLQRYAVFQIEPFDARAAIEVAAMTRSAKAKGNKRGQSNATWAKVKYDRQIVAIARVAGATTIYSDDHDIRSMAQDHKIKVLGVSDLPLPAEDAQMNFLANLQPAPVTIGQALPSTEPSPEKGAK